MADKHWYTALTGLAFVLIVVVGFAIVGDQPDPTDKPIQEIIDFYEDDRSTKWVSVFLEGIAACLLIIFGAHLRSALSSARILSPIILAGTILIGVGLAIDATLSVALLEATESDRIGEETIQTLAVLWSNDFVPFAVGIELFALATGLAVIRHGVLPKWLGWIAILFAVIAFTPAGFVAFLGMGVWVAVASVLLALRGRSVGTGPGPSPRPAYEP